MPLPKWAITVTPFSKLLALFLFITFPILGFYFGMIYQRGYLATSSVPSDKASIAKIVDSGSTNEPGYMIAIYADGSGYLSYVNSKRYQNGPYIDKSYSPGTYSRFINILNKIGDVSRIPEGNCSKSASFGTTTTVTFGGITSKDLQCIADDAPQIDKDLGAEVTK